jgi:hypothetical protein
MAENAGGSQGAGDPKAPPASSSDDVGAGLSAFLQALGSAGAKPPSVPAPDPKVSSAFALGWQTAELYRLHEWPGQLPASPDELPAELPGVGSLSAEQRGGVGLDQVDVALLNLDPLIKHAGLTPPDTKAARDALAHGVDRQFLWEVFELHVSLLSLLTAADFRLGKAYGLGRALADVCGGPNDLESLRGRFAREQIATVRAWIADLTTLFPPHAGHSVIQSLDKWVQWADGSAKGTPQDDDRTILLLRRQGERWRAVLSGEKAAVDLLELGDYVSAGFGMLKRLGSLTLRFAVPFLPLIVLIVSLIAGGVALILHQADSSHIAAGLGALIASAGLTWKGIGGSLGKVVGNLERPLWQAELDAAIAVAITLVPGTKRVSRYTPPGARYGAPESDASTSDAPAS